MALTDTAIRSLKPKERRYTVTDRDGLVLEVYPTGGMLWHYRYRLNGKQERVTLGRYPALTLKLARSERDKARTNVALGNSPAKLKRQRKAGISAAMTVEVLAGRFLREVVAKDRKDITIPKRYIDKEIVPAIGGRAVGEVTTEDVRAIIWRKKDAGFDAAAGDIRGTLKRLFDFAVTLGVTQANPVLALPMRHVHKPKARDRTLEPGEIRSVLKGVVESNMRRQFKLGLQLILLTLVRKSELLLARKEHVDLDAAEWQIPASNSKTGVAHIVYLSRQAVELFKELFTLAGDSELVMPGRGSLTKPFAHNAINTALKVSLQNQSITHFTIHDLRRTASTLLNENNWAPDVIEKALNHTVGGVRGVYNRAEYATQRREMLQFWADYIDGLLTGAITLARFRRVA